MSNPVFLFAAAGAVLLALAFIVFPLLGSRNRAALAGAIIFIPAATLGIYAYVGTPGGIAAEAGETGEIRAAVADLARRAMREPDSAENWGRLGLAYKSLEEFGSAEHAFRRALFIDDDADFIRAELGETLLYASGERELPEEARRLLEQAAASDNQKALWLLGLDAFQREAHADAVSHFERLLSLLPGDSNVRNTVEQYLANARAGESGQRPESAAAPADGPSLKLSVAIEESLARELRGDETVFIAVRRAAGGPPLAVRRLRADELPAELTIDDSDAMTAGNGLSSADSIVVLARVSFSGDATPQTGDFEGRTDILPVDEPELHAEITIEQVL